MSGSLFDRVSLEEDQSQGQMVISYEVDVLPVRTKDWFIFSSGYTIGSKRIDVSVPVTGSYIRLVINSAFAMPKSVQIRVYAPEPCHI